MTRTRTALTLDLGILAALYLAAWWVVGASLYTLDPVLVGRAVAIDLVVTACAVHYLLGVRMAGLPTWTVSPVALAGVVVAGSIVPGVESMGVLALLLVGVEIMVGAVAILRGKALATGYRTARAQGECRLDALQRGLGAATESTVLAAAVVSELRLVQLGLFGVFQAAPTGPGRFTVHREVGWVALAGVLVFLAGVEIPAAHLLLDHFLGGWVAWPVTVLSAYGVVWIWGDAQAMRLHPIEVRGDELHLRVGLRWRSVIPVADIVQAEAVTERGELDISLMSPNLRLRLRRPATFIGLFGVTRRGRDVTLRVDRPQSFVEALGPPGGG